MPSKIWEFLNTDVTDLIGGVKKDGQPDDAIDTHADEIFAIAEAEARRRGIPIQQVLAEKGFSVGSTPAGPSRPTEAPARRQEQKRESMLRTLAWVEDEEVGGRSSAPLPTPVAVPSEEAEARLIAALSPVDEDDVLAVLQGYAAETKSLSEKLLVLGVLAPSALRSARKRVDRGMAWWESLLAEGVAPETLAELLRTEPYFPPVGTNSTSFKEYLVDTDRVRFKEIRLAESEARKEGVSYLKKLVEAGAIAESALFEATVDYSGAQALSSVPKRIARTLASSFPIGWVRAFKVVPVKRAGGAITVIAPFVLDGRLLAQLQGATGAEIYPRVAPYAVASELASKHTDRWEETGEPDDGYPAVEEDLDDRGGPRTSPEQQQQLKAAITERSAVEIVRKLVQGALEARATDIHLEPMQEDARVRYRIDGILHDVLQLKIGLFEEVVARLKILADLDITERRRPQDGHIAINIDEKTWDLRIASVPAKAGEKLAIRIAEAGRSLTTLDQLGLSQGDLARVRGLASKPFGMILATGPVGSGKTTSLYACLGDIDRSRYQIVSIEDPVEIRLDGANQVEVNYELGVDFVLGLRALLRQDPDVILVGEIRDEETAKIAVRASMTGLLVFSTLHTNDTTGTITALRNFDIAPHLISSSLLGVIAQRLIRKICEGCKTSARKKKTDADALGLDALPKGFSLYEGKGCPKCFETGYLGRTGVFEVFGVDRAAREMILSSASEREIRDHAIKNGMTTLQHDGVEKVRTGITTVAEFERVLRL